MAIKTVIFDMDGTITRPFLDFDLIRREMGLPPDAGPILELMERMSQEERARAEEVLLRHETNAVAESVLNESAESTLEALRAVGINIGVLTRNTRANVEAVARKHNLRFDAIVDREDGPVKPDAFGVLELCRRFRTRPEETIVVGDFLFDVLSAKAAGAIAVLLVNCPKAQDYAEYADYVITSLDEVLDIIDNIGRNVKGSSC
ncbi:MAG TPA: HAD family hydrolase [Anaerohalosphaeraceae bacterium]|jgi:HAD superfamily hydrolase (TIGR01509 family)|nr:HAD family hydrolase [Anaerohalosphaeraceae bacterium]HRT50907.1 HAD family hydrolase [Anaerohalosphaeraceae bacterium]HRT86889.1 HAD family hydrolase [Anaerohalosphaeraceae bacterium]